MGFTAKETAIRIRQSGISLDDSQVESLIKSLVAERTLIPCLSITGNFVLAPNLRPWKSSKLYVTDTIHFDIQERDLGIWLESSSGLPNSVPPIQFQCFYLCIGIAATSLTKAKYTTADVREYMVYRARQFKNFYDKLVSNEHAMATLEAFFTEAVSHNPQVNPADGSVLPPFYCCIDNIKEIADCATNDGYACPYMFKFCLPTELSEFNWLVVSCATASVGVRGGTHEEHLKSQTSHLFLSHKPRARTIGLILTGGSRGHFIQFLLPQNRQQEFIDHLMTPALSTRMQLANPDSGYWPPIAPLFYNQSLANFLKNERIDPQIVLPTSPEAQAAEAQEL